MHRAEPPPPADAEEPSRATRSRRWWPWVVGTAAVVVALVVAGIITTRESAQPPGPSAAEINAAVQAAVQKGIEQAKAAPPDSALAYQAILPSLVVIQADLATSGPDNKGLGSGVIVNQQGAILTARHVVAGATAIHVTFADGTKATAQVVSEQANQDIAVLATDASPATIVPAVLGSSAGLHVGDATFAVGHPLGLTGSLSAGVISGLDRSVAVPGGTTLQGLIQFDAAVNPGSSGGPLLNRSGQVIGIVTGLANPSDQGYFIGIGFAVPIGTASGAAGGPDQ